MNAEHNVSEKNNGGIRGHMTWTFAIVSDHEYMYTTQGIRYMGTSWKF